VCQIIARGEAVEPEVALVSPSEHKKITVFSGSITQTDSLLVQILANKLPPFRKRCSRGIQLAASSLASINRRRLHGYLQEGTSSRLILHPVNARLSRKQGCHRFLFDDYRYGSLQ